MNNTGRLIILRSRIREILPLREGALGGDGDLALVAGDGDGIAEGSGLATGDLDALLQELLERGDVHDLVLDGLPAVDHEGRPLLLPALRRRRWSNHLLSLCLPPPRSN